jgi:hypothetical protein
MMPSWVISIQVACEGERRRGQLRDKPKKSEELPFSETPAVVPGLRPGVGLLHLIDQRDVSFLLVGWAKYRRGYMGRDYHVTGGHETEAEKAQRAKKPTRFGVFTLRLLGYKGVPPRQRRIAVRSPRHERWTGPSN